jgi:Flp pilus assembly protein TadG
MTGLPPCPARTGLLARLLRDRAGNTLAMAAAALFPLLGLIGGGVDIARGYLSQSRLQQACDSGVLAARKRLGTEVAVTGEIPDIAADSGQRFFNLNFHNGAYGTENRNFEMTLEDDFSITGRATVDVPTTLMAIFGFSEMPVNVECQAQLNMANMDVMMVLDTTGSMAWTNTGDSQPKIAVLRDVVESFHAQLEANKAPGARTRYGFVPYSSNVNVGNLLKSDWMADEITLPARVAVGTGASQARVTPVSGTAIALPATTAATCPPSTVTWIDSTITATSTGRAGRSTVNGIDYQCVANSATGLFSITGTVYTNYVIDWFLPNSSAPGWRYELLTMDVSALNGASGDALILDGNTSLPASMLAEEDPLGLLSQFQGCIMERQTYEIADYDSVDLDRALDLDIDRIPDAADPTTQWRPLLSEISLTKTQAARQITDLDTMLDNVTAYLQSSQLLARPSCPTRAQKLAEMSAGQVSAYVNSLQPVGNTYHDIGMIWGGRLLSPTGLFAAENVDLPNRPTSRHLVFLTDGETATASSNYATYGLESVEQRRWQTRSPMTLNRTVEERFAYACEQVKNKNVTVWVISFGTAANPVMEACSGADRYFVADDAEQLEETFATIAKRMGELRVTR